MFHASARWYRWGADHNLPSGPNWPGYVCVQAPLFSNNCRWGEKYIDYKLSLLIYGFLRFLSWPNFAKHHMTTQVSILPVSYWMRASTLRTDKVSEQRPTQNWIECFVAEFFLENHKSWGGQHATWEGLRRVGRTCSLRIFASHIYVRASWNPPGGSRGIPVDLFWYPPI